MITLFILISAQGAYQSHADIGAYFLRARSQIPDVRPDWARPGLAQLWN